MDNNIQRVSATVAIADSQTVGSTAIARRLNGILRGVMVNAPQLDGTTTVTVDVLDSSSFVVFTKASIAENAKTPIFIDANNQPLQIPLSGTYTVRVTASGAQSGGNDSVVVDLLIGRGV